MHIARDLRRDISISHERACMRVRGAEVS